MLSVISYRPFENWSKNWNNYWGEKKNQTCIVLFRNGPSQPHQSMKDQAVAMGKITKVKHILVVYFYQ